ncbi:SIS domain-containing protein [Streptomyces sp. NPDC051896]|uniref:SIS domain-containing protein n=1 Tax=Streptomyces sp. NPDC051896 TaxID=3155416 RepID=UPI003447505A
MVAFTPGTEPDAGSRHRHPTFFGLSWRSLGGPSRGVEGHVQHVHARLLRRDAVCLAISRTGQTSGTLHATQAARAGGAGTIAVTSFFRSPLTEPADVSLVAGSCETSFRIEAVAGRIAHLAVLDALHTGVTLMTLERGPGSTSPGR